MTQAIPVDWTLSDRALTRTIRRADFVEALALVLQIAKLAEAADHHPDIDIRYNKVHLSLTTHSAGNQVTDKDFALAQKINEALESNTSADCAELRRRLKA